MLNGETFVRASFSGRQRHRTVPWKSVGVRPVDLKGRRHLQFTYSDGKQHVTKNLAYADAPEAVDDLLSQAFSSVYVETLERRIQVQVTRRGKTIVHEHAPCADGAPPSRMHDRRKDLPLPVGRPDEFLKRIGIATDQGQIRRGMRRKFRQINEFLRLVTETVPLGKIKQSPLHIVDCGCGSARLTLAAYHYLNHVLDRPARVTGVDVNAELLAQLEDRTRNWGWEGLRFEVTRIRDYQAPEPPAIVFALHACDTATDEALSQAVRWRSEALFCVPCCQHHLQQQMSRETVPRDLHAVARHGILRQRLGDLLTDGLRAQILTILGYRADVVEFVSTEHTAKNLMIRAVRTGSQGSARAIAAYRALVRRWNLTPYLAQLLAPELAQSGVDPQDLNGPG